MPRPGKFKIKMRKSARYGHKAVCTKAKRTAPMLQKIKSNISLTLKLNKPTHISTFTNKKTQQIFFENLFQKILFENLFPKSFVNDSKFEFSISTHKPLQVLSAPKIKNSRFLKRKDSFPNGFPRIKKPKRNHSDSLIHVHRKIPNMSGYQIIFLPKVETSNTSIFSEVLTAAEVERLNLHHNKTNTSNLVDLFEKRCELIRFGLRKKKKGEKYHQIIELQKEAEKIPIVYPNRFFPFLKDYLRKHKQKQYAFAIFIMKHSKNIIVSAEFEPDYENDKHSEPLLCEEIENFFHVCGILVESILVYTFNSPCLDCASLLLKKASYWHSKYGFSTTVTFTKFYGLSSKESFQSITHSSPDMFGPCGVFYEARRGCERELFTLDTFVAKKHIYQNIRKLPESKERAGCRKIIEFRVAELQKLAKNSVCPLQEHLRRGKKTIDSFKFPPTIQKECVECLLEAWCDLVYSSAMKIIRNNITKNFNVAVVEVLNHKLKSICGTNGPLKLYQTPPPICKAAALFKIMIKCTVAAKSYKKKKKKKKKKKRRLGGLVVKPATTYIYHVAVQAVWVRVPTHRVSSPNLSPISCLSALSIKSLYGKKKITIH
ncbi:uncharacterized protein LOC115782197 [Archocentrus centrarchus]|uniref:uncharacterized protein LOC115782197 n=1 Tax=Archocentrus centrarchus TaxID=63155 RepID=UPI0011E9DA19|nr:uncharacterized protein LOC115782197 [Archocentrus centrarchus]XP_030588123.1 uncharacterized protein LOC115782197 [Archocentrus centrarchus]